MTYNERRLQTIEKAPFEIDVEKYKSIYLEDIKLQEYSKVKSIIKVGDITIYNPTKFNKFQKWLWKKLLNIEIEDVEVEQ